LLCSAIRGRIRCLKAVYEKYQRTLPAGMAVPTAWLDAQQEHRAAFENFFVGWKPLPPSMVQPQRRGAARVGANPRSPTARCAGPSGASPSSWGAPTHTSADDVHALCAGEAQLPSRDAGPVCQPAAELPSAFASCPQQAPPLPATPPAASAVPPGSAQLAKLPDSGVLSSSPSSALSATLSDAGIWAAMQAGIAPSSSVGGASIGVGSQSGSGSHSAASVHQQLSQWQATASMSNAAMGAAAGMLGQLRSLSGSLIAQTVALSQGHSSAALQEALLHKVRSVRPLWHPGS
jgi:hypothetical protein